MDGFEARLTKHLTCRWGTSVYSTACLEQSTSGDFESVLLDKSAGK